MKLRMKNFGLHISLAIICSVIQAAPLDYALAASNSSLDICKIVACGKGTCNHTSSDQILADFIPTCECDRGWKQPNIGFSISFLPCVIPNCTLDYGCSGNAPSSASAPLYGHNDSTNPLHPCNYAVCGEGMCVKTSEFGYNCNCYEGYENILNFTSGPCIRECSIGADCKNLGFSVGGNGTASPPAQSDVSGTEGVVGFVKDIPCLMAMAILTIFVSWAQMCIVVSLDAGLN